MKISDFEWDEWNSQHIEIGHGIEPEEAEEVFAATPLFRKTKKRHYVAMGPTLAGRYLIVVSENISVKVDPLQIQAIKKVAAMKSTPYQILISHWLSQNLKEELPIE